MFFLVRFLNGRFLSGLILVLAILIASVSVFAHHGGAAYDEARTVTIKGTVTEWIWSNPHCVLYIDSTDDSGKSVSWIMETENPLSMANIGWGKASFKVGDQVSVTALPAKNGKPIGRIVEAVQANGQKLAGKAHPRSSDASTSN